MRGGRGSVMAMLTEKHPIIIHMTRDGNDIHGQFTQRGEGRGGSVRVLHPAHAYQDTCTSKRRGIILKQKQADNHKKKTCNMI